MKRAFTQIELLIVIAIVAVLASWVLSAVRMARDSAGRMRCSNQLRQIAPTAH